MKKKLGALLLITVLFMIPVIGTVSAASKPIVYINKKYKFSLTLPASWKNAYSVSEGVNDGDTWLCFNYKKDGKIYKSESMFWIIISKRTKSQIQQRNNDPDAIVSTIYLGTKNGHSFEYGDGNLFGGDTELYNDKRFLKFVNVDAPKIAKTFKFIK